jgi:two-component system, LytTR family, response regulator
LKFIRALIVDDEPLARQRVRRLLRDEADIEELGECADGQQAVRAIETLRPDLVFLDIQLPEMSGFRVVEAVGPEHMPIVIFVTAYDRYALQAFDAQALDYLLKPYSRERFRRALERARRQLSGGPKEQLDERLTALLSSLKPETKYLERLMIKAAGRVYFLKVEEINWVGAEGNYLRLHAGDSSHLLRDTLSRLAGRLDPKKFLRIHRSTLVHVDRIRDLRPLFSGDYTMRLIDGTELTLSRSYREKFLELFDQPH